MISETRTVVKQRSNSDLTAKQKEVEGGDKGGPHCHCLIPHTHTQCALLTAPAPRGFINFCESLRDFGVTGSDGRKGMEGVVSLELRQQVHKSSQDTCLCLHFGQPNSL